MRYLRLKIRSPKAHEPFTKMAHLISLGFCFNQAILLLSESFLISGNVLVSNPDLLHEDNPDLLSVDSFQKEAPDFVTTKTAIL